jgi:DnaJ domain/Protein of unknown function (DUF1232)
LSLSLKIILIAFGLLYLISPVDIIPDFLLPYIGWIDDGVVLGTIYYLIRYGRLPFFLFNKKAGFKQSDTNKTENFASNNKHQQNNGPAYQRDTSSKTIPTPYEILGIDPKASNEEIQAAYKKAIKKYHPDKVSHLGEEFSNLANKKFLEIQNAYDILMRNKDR